MNPRFPRRLVAVALLVLWGWGSMQDLSAQGNVTAWGRSDYGQLGVPSDLTNAMAVAGGYLHSLALKADGRVVAWGDNRFSQTNVPADLTNVTAIAAGFFHNLALKSNGTVVAWGEDMLGETVVPWNLTNAVAVAAGPYRSLALKADGTVVAWGDVLSSMPGNLSNVVAIAEGGTHEVALKGDGTVLAWGGQTNVPLDLTNAVAIAAGIEHSMALKADGTVVAWGSQTNVPPGLTNVAAIAAGSSHNLALLADGTVVAWGNNSHGQATVPEGLMNVVHIAGGSFHSLAARGSGRPFITASPVGRTALLGSTVCFRAAAAGATPLKYQWRCNGTNIAGATNPVLSFVNVQPTQAGTYSVLVTNTLGSATSSNVQLALVPFVVTARPQSQRALVGTTVNFSVAAQTVAPLACQWRFNGTNLPGATNSTLALNQVRFDQAGPYAVTLTNLYGTLTTAEVNLTVALVEAWGNNGAGQTNVPAGLTNAVAVAGGGSHSLALRADGTVVAWGAYFETNVPSGLTDAVAIAAGEGHSLALKADGTVVGWGNWNSYYGQTNIPAGLTNALAVSAGFVHSLALKTDGTVIAWGDNFYGQTNPPPGLSHVIAIAAGGSHNLALKADGTVVAWGDGSHGQTNVPFDLTNAVAIAGGHACSLALKADGTVAAWGAVSDVPSNLSNVVALAGGYSHNLALKADGTLATWGGNAYGVTNLAASWSNVVAIAAGDYHNLALAGCGLPILTGVMPSRSSPMGSRTYFCAAAAGANPLSYQWQCNGTNLTGATNRCLSLTNLQAWQTGAYRVIVSNSLGSVTSSVAGLTVSGGAPGGLLYLTNAMFGTGGQFQLQAVSDPGLRLFIQASTNLVSWNTLAILTNTSGLAGFTDPATNFTRRFYRLSLSASASADRPTLSLGWSNNVPLISLWGTVGNSYALEYIGSLSSVTPWQGLVTNVLIGNPMVVSDPAAAEGSKRFYRARLIP